MRPILVIGLVLVILGVLALGYEGVAWITTRETVARVGPVEVQVDRQRTIPLAPILSALALSAGAVLLIVGASQKKTG
jgi:hypothetical protein